jgi:hypothetical protein
MFEKVKWPGRYRRYVLECVEGELVFRQPEIAAAIEAALAHAVKNTVEAAYKRTNMLEARQRLMQAWSDYITGRTADADKVLKMPPRAIATG